MKNWRLWVSLLISAVFVYISLRQIKDPHAFLTSFREIKLWTLIPTAAFYALVMVTRAWRWDYIMASQVKVRYSSAISGLIIGYAANNILPFRAGELIRAVAVSKREKQNFSPIFASVVVERIFDSLAVLVFLAVILIFLQFPPEHAELKKTLRAGGIGAMIGSLGLMASLYLLFYARDWSLGMAGKILKPVSAKLSEFAVRELERFSQGLIILGKPSRMIVVMLQSFLVWLVNMVPIWFVGVGFGVRLDFMGTLLILFLGAFSAAIPAAPGFIGTFHYITTKGMVFLGALPQESALSFAIILHAFYYFPTLIIGLILVWAQGTSLFALKSEAQEEEKIRETRNG
jgi:glycosyltransferase 2 family protein